MQVLQNQSHTHLLSDITNIPDICETMETDQTKGEDNILINQSIKDDIISNQSIKDDISIEEDKWSQIIAKFEENLPEHHHHQHH